MKKNLTDKAVRGLKPGTARFDVWDSSFTGGAFGVRVSPSGLRTFQWMARDRFGKKRRGTVGTYPEKSLSEAREAARQAIADLKRGVDPRKPEGPTFADLAADFMRKHPKMKKLSRRTVKEYARILDKDLLPEWGERAVSELTRADVGKLLDDIAFERESPVMANRVLALASVMFNYGIDAGRFLSGVQPVLPDAQADRRNPEGPDVHG